MKYYITSDVHGYCSILKEVLAKAAIFEERGEHKLVILGDMFNRGHETEEQQDFILELMEKDQVILIRGNHEDLFAEMVTEDECLTYRHHVRYIRYSSPADRT